MRAIVKDSTDQSVVIRIIDSTDGTPETAVEHDTGGIDLWYRREGATKTAITEAALAALDSAHSDGGIEHIGDGYYRLDLPDAAVATGANGVMVGGAVTGMIVIGCYIPLTDVNPYDSVRAGMTALPNAAADAAGGLPISDAGGLDMDATDTAVAGIQTDLDNATDGLGALKTLIEAVPTATEIQTEMEENGASVLDTLQDRLTATRATYLDYLFSIYFGLVSAVAQAQGGAAGTITLAAAASSVNDFYKGQIVVVYTGTGAGQARACYAYDGESKVASVRPNWATAPDATSWYVIIATGSAVVAAIEDIDLSATMKASVNAECDTAVADVKAVTDKLDDTLEDDGGTYRFTENALEEAPSGAGGGTATVGNQETIIKILTNKWEVTGNQFIIYDDDGTTPIYTFDLTQDGVATEYNPDLRTPV